MTVTGYIHIPIIMIPGSMTHGITIHGTMIPGIMTDTTITAPLIIIRTPLRHIMQDVARKARMRDVSTISLLTVA